MSKLNTKQLADIVDALYDLSNDDRVKEHSEEDKAIMMLIRFVNDLE